MKEYDISNEYMIGVQGDSVVFLRPPEKMTKEKALIMAAIIVSIADDNDEFGYIIEAVQK